ncbi:rnf111 [Symbiodinium natans]|uniref:Rnf111 protein n=1 Tax=Symbiodinium natans TaxID=878477 RepID=A0A812UQX6_9DINO|nr:rnf111 [Symbiodinium natans]
MKSPWAPCIARIFRSCAGEAASPEAAAVSAVAELGGSLKMTRLRRRGLFSFKELDPTHDAAVALGEEYLEHQMVYRLRASESFQLAPNDRFEQIGWFGQGEIPFDEMPEDDKVWYDQVLFHDAMLRGSFAFRGRKKLRE